MTLQQSRVQLTFNEGYSKIKVNLLLMEIVLNRKQGSWSPLKVRQRITKMKLRIADGKRKIIAILGIGCVVCLILGFGIVLHAQEENKSGFYRYKIGDGFGESSRDGENEGTSRDAT